MKSTKNTSANTSANKSKEAKAQNGAFDVLIETQTQLVDKFVDSSKQFFSNFENNEMIEKSRTQINEWLEKQQHNLSDSFAELKKQVRFENAPEVVREIVEAQEQLGKEWFEALRGTLKSKDSAELNEILSANVQKLQDNVKEISTYWLENFGKPVNFSEMMTADYAKSMTKKMVDMWTPAKIS